MRIGGNVLLKDAAAVQSYAYDMYRPLGNLQNVISHLDDYECDEICITRPTRNVDPIASFDSDIHFLKYINSSTPISFGGGLRSTHHIEKLVGLPIERLHFSSAFIIKNIELILYAKKLFGGQAIQCCLPISRINKEFYVLNSATNRYCELNEIDFEFINLYANEIILIDTNNEGYNHAFDFRILDQIKLNPRKILLSGGMSTESIYRAKKLGVTGILIDNKILHCENSIWKIKHGKM